MVYLHNVPGEYVNILLNEPISLFFREKNISEMSFFVHVEICSNMLEIKMQTYIYE